MRHGRKHKRLGLTHEHRRALLRNLARSLIGRQQVVTTHASAKEAARFVDQLVTIAKQNTLHARRHLIQELGSGSEALAQRMLNTIAPKFKDRKGGYTRVLHYRVRPGDGASVSLLEFTIPIEEAKPKKPKKEKSPKLTAPEKAKEEKKPEKRQAAKETKEEISKKETAKKGGFLSSLRRFLKGDDEDLKKKK